MKKDRKNDGVKPGDSQKKKTTVPEKEPETEDIEIGGPWSGW